MYKYIYIILSELTSRESFTCNEWHGTILLTCYSQMKQLDLNGAKNVNY